MPRPPRSRHCSWSRCLVQSVLTPRSSTRRQHHSRNRGAPRLRTAVAAAARCGWESLRFWTRLGGLPGAVAGARQGAAAAAKPSRPAPHAQARPMRRGPRAPPRRAAPRATARPTSRRADSPAAHARPCAVARTDNLAGPARVYRRARHAALLSTAKATSEPAAQSSSEPPFRASNLSRSLIAFLASSKSSSSPRRRCCCCLLLCT